MLKFLKQNFFAFVFLSLLIVIVFKNLPQTFYQQDEWFSLGAVISTGPDAIFTGVWQPLDLLFVKGRILSGVIGYLFLNYFPLENSQLAIFAIALHIIATLLVYLLIYRFLKNLIISLLGACFFAVNAVSHGAVTWPIIAVNTVTSTILIILGIFFFFKYLDNFRLKWAIISGLMIYISLWFKETGTYLFLSLPLSVLLFKRFTSLNFLKTFWFFILPFVSIIIFRIIQYKSLPTVTNLYITGQNEHFFSTLILRAFLYPLTSFSLMFVPGGHFLSFAREILREIYPFFSSAENNILIAQSVILDLLSTILTGVIFLLVFILNRKETLHIKRLVYFWLIFTFMSFLPYILQSKDFSYLESRYYYLSVVGASVLLAWVLKRLWEIFPSGRRISGQSFFYTIILPICIIYLIVHANVVRGSIAEQVKIANLQKSFIAQLKTLVPTLDNKRSVFYTSSDQNFWAEGNKLPFQQGSGYTLMILYYDSKKIPNEFLRAQSLLEDGFLFGIGTQGYKEKGEYGFGYFWDKNELEKALKQYNLPTSSVIKLEYNSNTNKLKRINYD